jgi:hypothetical protein
MARQLVPGLVLPGAVYFAVSRFAPVMVALAAASSVPLLDAVLRLARRRAPTPASVVFLLVAGVSVGLALHFRSPLFILARGAAISAGLGLAFALSAVVGRPLTRTLALRLSTEHREARLRLAERWGHPRALRVFRILSLGWGVLLLASAAQQAVVVLTMSPGVVMALEPPVRTAVTAIGVLTSVLYVRRIQQLHPDLRLLPALVRRSA